MRFGSCESACADASDASKTAGALAYNVMLHSHVWLVEGGYSAQLQNNNKILEMQYRVKLVRKRGVNVKKVLAHQEFYFAPPPSGSAFYFAPLLRADSQGGLRQDNGAGRVPVEPPGGGRQP